MKLNLEFDPLLLEQAVPLALNRMVQNRPLQQRARANRVRDPKNRSIRDAQSRWLAKLSLLDCARRAILEGGKSLSGISRWLITGASFERLCGAEMTAAEGTRRLVIVRVLPATLADGALALSFFRCELLTIADILDPAFEYQPRLTASSLGPLESRRIQDRISMLWRCSVQGRLVREGKLPAEQRNQSLAQFRILLPSLEDRTQECFERIFAGPRPLHSVFVALATEPEVAFGLQRRSMLRRRRCPLCGFHTADFEPGVRDLPYLVCRAIYLDFPGWKAEMGLCRLCANLYRSLSSHPTHGVPCSASSA
jgi:hypothetical protein